MKTPDYVKHVAEYFVFSLLVFRALKNTNNLKEHYMLFTVVFITLFGISDEMFQAFVPGRQPSIFDVMYNSFSSIFFIGISKVITLI